MRLHLQNGFECSPHAPSEDSTNRRSAFTLTELLVVIAIIAILSALGTWGVFAMIGSRQKSNSELTVRVVNKMLQDRWAQVVAEAKKEQPSATVTSLAGDAERARVLWVKVRLVEAFPMRYAETTDVKGTVVFDHIPANRRKAHFNKYKQALGTLSGSPPGESSACLLMALKTLQGDAVAVDDQIKHAIAPSDGSNPINILVDGFGKPLQFERFFTGAPNPAPAGSRNAKFGDSIDNDGKLLPAWPGRATFEGNASFHAIGPVGGNATYLIPRISSAGRDGILGTPDDIHNFLLRGD